MKIMSLHDLIKVFQMKIKRYFHTTNGHILHSVFTLKPCEEDDIDDDEQI